MRALDGLRGLAAVAIVIHHCFTTVPVVPGSFTQASQATTEYFYLGVDLFFVLSGYLITSLLLLARRSPAYYRNFYWKRAFRILPAMLLVLILTRIFFHTAISGSLAALFFVANITFAWHVPDIGPYWTLSIEEQFYLLWPTVIHRTRPRTILRILIALIVIPTLLRLVSFGLNHGNARYTPLHCDGLAWGALLAFVCFFARLPFTNLNAAALWKRYNPPLIILGTLVLAVAVFLQIRTGISDGLLLTACGPLFTMLILFLLTHRKSLAARVLGSRPLRFLGDVSYMTYLSHSYILEAYDRYHPWPAHPTAVSLYGRFAVILTLTLLFSATTLYLFERPIGSLRRYFIHPE